MKNFDVTLGMSRDFQLLYNGMEIGHSMPGGIFSIKDDIFLSGKIQITTQKLLAHAL